MAPTWSLGSLGCTDFGPRDPFGKHPRHPQKKKIESKKNDQARLRAPLVLSEEPNKVGGEVADNHEDDIVDDETHDALRKKGVAPTVSVTRFAAVSTIAMTTTTKTAS
jgi:hypothetical protein